MNHLFVGLLAQVRTHTRPWRISAALGFSNKFSHGTVQSSRIPAMDPTLIIGLCLLGVLSLLAVFSKATWHWKQRRLRDRCVVPAEWECLSGGTNLQHQEAKKCSFKSIGWSAPVKNDSHHHGQSPDSRTPAACKKIGFGPGVGWWSTDLVHVHNHLSYKWKGSAR